MPKRISDFEKKARFIIEAVQRKGGRVDYASLFHQVKELGVWRTNPSEAVTGALIGMAREEMIAFLDSNGRDVTENVLNLPDEKKRKAVRVENLTIQLNIENEYVENVIESFGVFEVPAYLDRKGYDLIASADVLASRFGSIAVMWTKTIIVEVTGYRIWMGISRGSKKEMKFFYVTDGECISIPRLADIVQKNLNLTEISDLNFDSYFENSIIHFYSEVPYNSGFIMSSAIAVLLMVGMEYLRDSNSFKDAVSESKCITSRSFEKCFDRHEILADAIALADNMHIQDKWPIPSTTSTSAEYLLLFGSPKPANVFCYRNRGETAEKMKPEVHSYHFDRPLFTDIWTGVGHDFPEILKSIRRRSYHLPEAEKFLKRIAEDLTESVWNYGKTGLDLIQEGMIREEVEDEKIAEGFSLLKVAIYEQLWNSLRFTYEYLSYPHIANLTQILTQHGKYGSPVGVGGGGFFQLLNENFKEDGNFSEMLLEVCRDWCIYHGGRIVRNLPYILPKKENRFLWGVIIHKAE